jgi:hypothetical protein
LGFSTRPSQQQYHSFLLLDKQIVTGIPVAKVYIKTVEFLNRF